MCVSETLALHAQLHPAVTLNSAPLRRGKAYQAQTVFFSLSLSLTSPKELRKFPHCTPPLPPGTGARRTQCN